MIGVWLRAAKLLPHGRVLLGKFGVQHDAEWNIELLEHPPNARDAPVDRVLAECLVHEVGVAGRQVRSQYRALPEAELLDEQREANRDLPAGGPSGHTDRLARKAGHPLGIVLRQGHRGKLRCSRAGEK